MPDIDAISDPPVRAVVAAINAADRDGFFASITSDATLSDDGVERDLTQWVDREVFISHGRMENVVSQSEDGRSFVVDYRNDTYGLMRTAWKFEVSDGKVSRIETGQA
ncbi:nuclear transport factor 2 family protein [Amycolatopsis cihanbeyliensis]|uniref:SnoaL-like protein n=1 Tax=Amycolatopsis cihanbeyliensis TaxID=1128664 RepID=A0A542DQA6_AMYCI|nr:nuclear transport factor 2 family protein [Amycolatopsis cihanbeyliensis]TQJ05291.1 hypothetical protein FB471_5119 [Amycolatopsis cihanbeyliensis]